MFYIRADGNEKIGMGHIMRSLTIAEALRERGAQVCFLSADEKPEKLIRAHGFPVRILFTDYNEMEVELPQLMNFLTEKTAFGESAQGGETAGGKPKLLIDSYFITPFYLQNLRLFATVILLDDNKNAIYPCDALINYNIYGKTLGYEEEYPAGVKLFLGCGYAPLREQFRDVTYTIRDQVKHILFTTGGGDSFHAALTLAKRLLAGENRNAENTGARELSDGTASENGAGEDAPGGALTWHFLIGPYCPDIKELEEIAAGHNFLKIHKNVTNVSELMSICDIAVSAAGSTLYELCSVGVPTIGFTFADNQRRNMEAFSRLTPVLDAGDFSVSPEAVLAFMEKGIAALCGSKELREKISAAMRSLIDGRGTGRLAEALLAL